MRERLAVICRELRTEAKQSYFKQCRTALLRHRQQEGVWNYSADERDMWGQEERTGKQANRMELESTEQYINIDAASLGEAVSALRRITDEINWSQEDHQLLALDSLLLSLLRLPSPASSQEFEEHKDMLVVILRQANLSLQSTRPTAKPHNKLTSIFSQTMPALLEKNEAGMTRQLVEVSYELTTRYCVLPVYRLIRHVLVSAGSAEGLEAINGEVQDAQLGEYHSKLEDLLLRYLLLYRVEEQSYSNKHCHVPGQQVVHDYLCFIKEALRKVVHCAHQNQNPFEDESLCNSVSFTLALYTQLVHKFQHASLEDGQSLVDKQTVQLLQKIALTHSGVAFTSSLPGSLLLGLNQIVSMLLGYLNEQDRTMQADFEYALDATHQSNYLLGLLLVIELKLR